MLFVAAFAPDTGENCLGLTGKFPGSTLPGALGQQGQVGGRELPFGVADVGVVGLAMGRHALNYEPATTKVRNTL